MKLKVSISQLDSKYSQYEDMNAIFCYQVLQILICLANHSVFISWKSSNNQAHDYDKALFSQKMQTWIILFELVQKKNGDMRLKQYLLCTKIYSQYKFPLNLQSFISIQTISTTRETKMAGNIFSASNPPHERLENSYAQNQVYMQEEEENIHDQGEISDHYEQISNEGLISFDDDCDLGYMEYMEEQYPDDEFDILDYESPNDYPQSESFGDDSKNDDNYTGEYYPGYGWDMNLAKTFTFSQSQYYTCCSEQKIDYHITNEIEWIRNLTSLPFDWAFQLYSQCRWQMEQIQKLVDLKSSFKQVILYKEDYLPRYETQIECCEVCYEKSRLIANACGHGFCLNCWTQLLNTAVYSNSSLFPRCPKAQCNQKMNYQLSCIILKESENNQLKKQFNRMKILQYSKYNSSVKICPNPNCEMKFFINYLSSLPIICKCGMNVCAYCGKSHHYPISCAERQNWQRMMEDQHFKTIQLEAVQFKICPSCNEPIEKNGGCNQMTCKCWHKFCWICLEDWKTHKVCSGWKIYGQIQRDSNLEQERKKQESQEEFERYCKFEKRVSSYNYERLMRGLKEMGIPFESMRLIENSKEYLLLALRFCQSSVIYSFFKGENPQLSFYFQKVDEQLNQIDDYLTGIQKSYDQLSQSTHEETKEELKDMLLEGQSKKISNKLSTSKKFLMEILKGQ